MEEELIEIDDNELFLGDQHLKINSDNVTEKEEKNIIPEVEAEDSDDVIDVDDSVFNQPDDEDAPEKTTKKESRVKETKEETFDSNDDDENDSEGNLNEFSAFGSILAEKGFFPDVSEDELSSIEDEEGLSEILNKQLVTTFRQWQDNYKKNLVNNLTSEGYIKKEEIQDKLPQTYTEDQIKGNIDIAKAAIERYYKRIGTPDKEIQRIINSRDDLEESAIELNKLNAELDAKEQASLAEKLKQQEEQTRIQRQQFEETLKKNTFEYDEFIPGRKLRSRDKEEVFMNIEPTMTKINSDLAKYAPLLSYLDKYGILEGNFDKLIKEGASKQTSKFAEILKEKSRKSTGTTSRRRSEGFLDLDDSDMPQIYK